jgi:hypothetical protein
MSGLRRPGNPPEGTRDRSAIQGRNEHGLKDLLDRRDIRRDGDHLLRLRHDLT